MTTRGFEYGYSLDGSNATPRIMDWAMAAGTFSVGDLLVIDSSGYCDLGTASVTEVTAICMEDQTVSSAGTNGKVAVVTKNQVWRCSMDASSTNAKLGYTKKVDVVATGDQLDADDLTNGGFCPIDVSDTDAAGNVLAYGVFLDTTFGNA